MAFFFANKYVTMEIRLFLKGFDIIMAEEKNIHYQILIMIYQRR